MGLFRGSPNLLEFSPKLEDVHHRDRAMFQVNDPTLCVVLSVEGQSVQRKTNMSHFLRKLQCFLNDEDGPTSVEYAVMIMLIFLAVIVIVQSLGRMLGDSFTGSSQSIDKAIGGS